MVKNRSRSPDTTKQGDNYQENGMQLGIDNLQPQVYILFLLNLT